MGDDSRKTGVVLTSDPHTGLLQQTARRFIRQKKLRGLGKYESNPMSIYNC
jgi:hypothetical protein